MASTRRDVTFASHGSLCSGWLCLPDGASRSAPLPAVALAQGFSCVKEMRGYVEQYGRAFADAGVAALVFDYRFLGMSEGEPRQQVFPDAQQQDIKNAISFLQNCDEIDGDRIGLWGTSYGGAHVLHVGAFDRRVKAIVSQVPLVDGYANALRLMREDEFVEFVALIEDDHTARFRGLPSKHFPVVAPKGEQCVLPMDPSHEWFISAAETAPLWKNYVTTESLERFIEYAPVNIMHLIAPVPLMMIIGSRDTLTPPDLALRAYARALPGNKECVLFEGGHFTPYDGEGRSLATEAAIRWFKAHL